MYPGGLIFGDIEGREGTGCSGTKSSELPRLQWSLDETLGDPDIRAFKYSRLELWNGPEDPRGTTHH